MKLVSPLRAFVLSAVCAAPALSSCAAAQQSCPPPGNPQNARQPAPAAAPTPPPSFQASGLHGAIDQGGYSASTNGVTDDLVHGISSLKANGTTTQAAATDTSPCAAEDDLFSTGLALLTKGSFTAAEKLFTGGIAQYPDSMLLHIGAGVAATLGGQTDWGIDQFLAATNIDPTDGRPYPFLAAVPLTDHALRLRVQASAERFLSRNPNSAEANYFEALLLSRQTESRDNQNAGSAPVEALCRRALALDPSLAEAHLLLGRTLLRRHAYLAAVREYRAALDLQPSLGEAYYPMALAYRRTGHPAEAYRAMRLFLAWKAKTPNTDMASALARFSSQAGQPGVAALHPCSCDALMLRP